MEGLIMTAQVLLSLSILVGLHELGHLIAAKIFKMRVEKYSIGFPPKIFGVKYGGTEYSIGAIPLGGFVKISGMIDESLDTKSLNEPPKDYEFRAKPAWQRLIVMMGGIIVNVILGVFIYICLSYFLGKSYYAKEEVNVHGVYASELGKEIGFETGDKIVAINGEDFTDFNETKSPKVLMAENSYYTVLRGHRQLDIFVPSDLMDRLVDADFQFIEALTPFRAGKVTPNTEADRIGMQEGDRIISMAGEDVKYFQTFSERKKKLANQSVALTIQRGGELISTEVKLDETALIGFEAIRELELSHLDYSLGESIIAGTSGAFSAIWINAKALGKIIKGEMNPSKSLMGPIRIATEIFGGTWNWVKFWSITGLLSMILAFMNFLPIPALDGGHVMFLTYEIVSGRKPSDRFLETAQKFGMVILLLLMAFVIFNDIFRLDVIQNLIN